MTTIELLQREVILMNLVQIPERVLKIANLVSQFTKDEMAQLRSDLRGIL
jgi:hypothetical protein